MLDRYGEDGAQWLLRIRRPATIPTLNGLRDSSDLGIPHVHCLLDSWDQGTQIALGDSWDQDTQIALLGSSDQDTLIASDVGRSLTLGKSPLLCCRR